MNQLIYLQIIKKEKKRKKFKKQFLKLKINMVRMLS